MRDWYWERKNWLVFVDNKLWLIWNPFLNPLNMLECFHFKVRRNKTTTRYKKDEGTYQSFHCEFWKANAKFNKQTNRQTNVDVARDWSIQTTIFWRQSHEEVDSEETWRGFAGEERCGRSSQCWHSSLQIWIVPFRPASVLNPELQSSQLNTARGTLSIQHLELQLLVSSLCFCGSSLSHYKFTNTLLFRRWLVLNEKTKNTKLQPSKPQINQTIFLHLHNNNFHKNQPQTEESERRRESSEEETRKSWMKEEKEAEETNQQTHCDYNKHTYFIFKQF